MVGLTEITHRHALYAIAVLCIMTFSTNWSACFLLLCITSYAIHLHSGTSLAFMASAALVFAIVEVAMIKLGVRTARYDYAVPELGIPLWLLPWWAVRAHWVLDVYCVCGILQKKSMDKEPSSMV